MGENTKERNLAYLTMALEELAKLKDGWADGEPSVKPTAAALTKAQTLGPDLVDCEDRLLNLGACRDGALLFTLAHQDDRLTIEIWIEPDGSVAIC